MQAYDDVAAAAIEQIEAATAVEELDGLRPTLLGKKAPLTEAKKQLGALEPDQRKEAGQALNAARKQVEAAFDARRANLAGAARAEALEAERLDLTAVSYTHLTLPTTPYV